MGYSDNIVALRKKQNLTQAQLAEMVGVEQPTVQRWESGKRQPDFEALGELATALGVEAGELLSDAVVVPVGPKLYVKGEVAAGVWREAFEMPEEDWRSFNGRSDVTAKLEHRFGLRVIGDSMNLKYPHGSIVECVSLFGSAEAVPGKRVVVVRKRDDQMYEATVKKLVEQDGELWLVPESSNPAFRPIRLADPEPGILETRIAAVVVRALIDEE
ncbi:LexA family protein [Sphingomonas soli]|uniref:LexA family protein n=1 Tax=Sphingomonas soli TaxID=266127 RepID=UPI0008295315|nr:XRE family transcriptional regulator [Sphingomonas soli]